MASSPGETMEKGHLITLGHGQRTPEKLAQLLREHHIAYLVDVRSQPYSKYNPGFSKQPLESFLNGQGFKYVFMGDLLGGRPKDDSVYDSHGEIDYELLRAKDYFQKGIQRLLVAYEKGLTLALMCAEGSPQKCHRSKLIASELALKGIQVFHIDENDQVVEHAQLQQPPLDQLNLF